MTLWLAGLAMASLKKTGLVEIGDGTKVCFRELLRAGVKERSHDCRR
jgi:hypothetical protein